MNLVRIYIISGILLSLFLLSSIIIGAGVHADLQQRLPIAQQWSHQNLRYYHASSERDVFIKNKSFYLRADVSATAYYEEMVLERVRRSEATSYNYALKIILKNEQGEGKGLMFNVEKGAFAFFNFFSSDVNRQRFRLVLIGDKSQFYLVDMAQGGKAKKIERFGELTWGAYSNDLWGKVTKIFDSISGRSRRQGVLLARYNRDDAIFTRFSNPAYEGPAEARSQQLPLYERGDYVDAGSEDVFVEDSPPEYEEILSEEESSPEYLEVTVSGELSE